MNLKKVAICQYRLLHYRIALFEGLRQNCRERGIDLSLVHGSATKRERAKRDEGYLPWAQRVRNVYVPVGSRDLIWQPGTESTRNADLVIVMQENRILSNYPLILHRHWSARKVAYWGHGVNFQSPSPSGLLERWKRLMLSRVDWWFAYTEATTQILDRAGYPRERVTCLNNAIDNDGFNKDLKNVSDAEIQEFKETQGFSHQDRIGLFCGSLYPDKRLDFLLRAADAIRGRMSDFKLLIVGDGPSAKEIAAACVSRPWVKWLGVRRGKEKALCFRVADVVLNPGLVGLHVLDSFCAGVPMVTTSDARHSPEICYLKDGVNGLIVSGGIEQYAGAVVSVLQSSNTLSRLRTGAAEAARHYTLQNMINAYASGIEKCLEAPKFAAR